MLRNLMQGAGLSTGYIITYTLQGVGSCTGYLKRLFCAGCRIVYIMQGDRGIG